VHSDADGLAAQEHWAEIFEKGGVTLSLVGHQHVYSRLKPMTKGRPDYQDGITQIMVNSGLKYYSSADETYAERTVYATPAYLLARIDGDSMTVQCFDIDGNELDFIELSSRTALSRGDFVAKIMPEAVLLGYGGGEMGLNDLITNEQAATLLRRAAPAAIRDSGFLGAGRAASVWAAETWAWALGHGFYTEADDPHGTLSAMRARVLLSAFREITG